MKNDTSTHNVRYEKNDVKILPVIGIASFLIVVLIVLLIFLSDYFLGVKEQIVYETQLKPESSDLKKLREAELETLTSYKILDANRGIYQIPIDKAISTLAGESSSDQ